MEKGTNEVRKGAKRFRFFTRTEEHRADNPFSFIKTILNNQLTNLENVIDSFVTNRPQYESLTLLEKARVELSTLFSVNSLYWVFLRCKGLDPKDDANLASELNRIKDYMGKLKNFDEAAKRPKYANKTVERFVKHALFDDSSSTECTSSTTVEQIGEDVVEVCVIQNDVDDEIFLVHEEVDLPNVTEEDIDKQPAKKRPKRAR
uniref:Nuclear nucleic acid-binding protein C1D n=1 Tax=Globodera rostochiensis TaxID=31243 RepID=A0A914IAJ4_GLORO